jgi:hypothetical protein
MVFVESIIIVHGGTTVIIFIYELCNITVIGKLSIEVK